jgi:hypothetical protein
MERGNIAVTHEDLWVSSNDLVIQSAQDPARAIPASQTKNRLYLLVREHPHDVPGPFSVVSGQKTQSPFQAAPQFHLKPEFLEGRGRATDVLWVRWRTGWSYQPDRIPQAQSLRFNWSSSRIRHASLLGIPRLPHKQIHAMNLKHGGVQLSILR